jgi:hypothetical protein
VILLLAFGVVALVGVALAGALGVAPWTNGPGARRTVLGGMGPLVVVGAAGVFVVLLGAVAIAGVGLGGGSHKSEPESAPTTSTTISTSTTTSTSTAPRSSPSPAVADEPLEGPDVAMDAMDRDAFGAETPFVDKLAGRSVLRISAHNFEPNTTGLVEQCTLNRCANSFPVVFDEIGSARIQYLVGDTITGADGSVSTCRADEPPCAVRMRTELDTAFLTTVFRDAAPTPRRVTVTANARAIVDEAAVTVTAHGFTPGRRVRATLCAAPATAGTQRCGLPGPSAPFTIDAHGNGHTTVVLRGDRVGSDGATCGRDTRCGMVVAEEFSELPGPVVLVTFGNGRSARYEATRLMLGLALGGILVAIAFLLVRRTDWRKPTEADTPELDGAVLADL